MNRYPQTPARDDENDAAWLRAALRDDLAQTSYLDDDGFSARVVQELPAPRSRLAWLDGVGLVCVMAALGVGLGPLLGDWTHAIGALLDTLVQRVATLSAPLGGSLSLNAVLTALAPLAALALAAVLLAEI